jgi:hypothetical protein
MTGGARNSIKIQNGAMTLPLGRAFHPRAASLLPVGMLSLK